MSILQEYEEIRRNIGEDRYAEIVAFLKAHPHYLLSDVYYHKDVWEESVKWAKKNFGKSAAIEDAKTEEVPF